MRELTVVELLRRGEAEGYTAVRLPPGTGLSVLAKLGAGVLVGWEGTRPGSTAAFTAYDGQDANGRIIVRGTTPAAGAPRVALQFTYGLFVRNQNRFEAVTLFFV